jgi:hypothetical protein
MFDLSKLTIFFWLKTIRDLSFKDGTYSHVTMCYRRGLDFISKFFMIYK